MSWAAAIPSATRLIPSCTFFRVAALIARMVPSMRATSGMTFVAVPAMSRVTVITAGSQISIRRVMSACNAVTISHATGMGSRVRNGSDAWPPLPLTSI